MSVKVGAVSALTRALEKHAPCIYNLHQWEGIPKPHALAAEASGVSPIEAHVAEASGVTHVAEASGVDVRIEGQLTAVVALASELGGLLRLEQVPVRRLLGLRGSQSSLCVHHQRGLRVLRELRRNHKRRNHTGTRQHEDATPQVRMHNWDETH